MEQIQTLALVLAYSASEEGYNLELHKQLEAQIIITVNSSKVPQIIIAIIILIQWRLHNIENNMTH